MSIKVLEETSGVIEYIDSEETNTSMIALYPKNLEENVQYDYCEISPCIILGTIANCIPSLSMNQGPRNTFSTAHMKQCLGIYASNYRSGFDNKGQILK